jgi:Fe-S-cluster containining protein
MERRFHCTACGKCCFGWLPLTLDDAIANAGRFPLAMVWTAVRQGAKSFALTGRLGTTVTLRTKKKIAAQIAPTAYIPPSLPCPELTAEGLCAIHAEKPLRCRTMPFFPYRDENDQGEMLVPRKDWLCDTSDAAPVVYRDKSLVERGDFDRERDALLGQAPILRAYAERLLTTAPNVATALEKAAKKPRGGQVVLNFTAILSRLTDVDVVDFARRQHPVLEDFAEKVEGTDAPAEYARYYRESAAAMARFLEAR